MSDPVQSDSLGPPYFGWSRDDAGQWRRVCAANTRGAVLRVLIAGDLEGIILPCGETPSEVPAA